MGHSKYMEIISPTVLPQLMELRNVTQLSGTGSKRLSGDDPKIRISEENHQNFYRLGANKILFSFRVLTIWRARTD